MTTPNYKQKLATAKKRAEDAESKCVELANEIGRLQTDLEFAVACPRPIYTHKDATPYLLPSQRIKP